MDSLKTRIEIMKESRKRISQIGFGEPVTNICAGDRNPMLHSFFVRHNIPMKTATCTDKEGEFWDIDIDVVYPGHLDKETRKELFQPVWEANYGEQA